MTDKEIEEFAREISYDLNDPFCLILEKDKIEYAVKKGYEKGYEDCRHYAHDYYKPKWHDLRKNPNDLPKDNEYVVIYTDLENTYVARIPTGKDYYIARTGESIHGLAVIAWCELPQFKE